MSKPRGVGDRAADAEREEREFASAAAARGGGSQSFPSLRESITSDPEKKKMTLTEFHSETSSGAGVRPNELLLGPTSPKERAGEEMQLDRLGGGFSSYGRGRPRGCGREESGEGGGGSSKYRGFDDEQQAEADNWATGKKVLPSAHLGRPGRYGSLSGSGGGRFGGGSRADEVDSWFTGKNPPRGPPPSTTSTFGTGFRDSPGTETDRWSRGVVAVDHESNRQRPRVVLDPRKGGLGGDLEPVRANKPSPFGDARPREEVLADKGLDWKKLDVEIETKKSRSQSSWPTSAHSSRASSAHSISSGLQQQGSLENVVSKPKPKVNPFGEAKSREDVLQERKKDRKKINLELERLCMERPEAMMLDPQHEDIVARIRKTLLQVGVEPRPTLQIRDRQFSVRPSDLVRASFFGTLRGSSLTVKGRLIVRYLLAIAEKTGQHFLVKTLIEKMLDEPKPADVHHLLKMLEDNCTNCKLVFNHPCTWTPEKVNRSFSELKDYGHARIDVKTIIKKAAESVPITCFPEQNKDWAIAIDDFVDRPRSHQLDKYNFGLSIQKQLQDPSKYKGGLPVVYYIKSVFAHFVEDQEQPLRKKVDREEILDIVKVIFPAFIPEFIQRVIQGGIDKEHVDSLEH